MMCTALQTLALCALLVFSATDSRCISEDQLRKRTDKFRSFCWSEAVVEMVDDLRTRSLSPWSYSVDKDLNRIPQEIHVANCPNHSCIINQHQDRNFNSVPIEVSLTVLKKTPCQKNPNKYKMEKALFKFAVACTCAVPKYAK